MLAWTKKARTSYVSDFVFSVPINRVLLFLPKMGGQRSDHGSASTRLLLLIIWLMLCCIPCSRLRAQEWVNFPFISKEGQAALSFGFLGSTGAMAPFFKPRQRMEATKISVFSVTSLLLHGAGRWLLCGLEKIKTCDIAQIWSIESQFVIIKITFIATSIHSKYWQATTYMPKKTRVGITFPTLPPQLKHLTVSAIDFCLLSLRSP